MKKKSFLLVMPEYSDFTELFEKNLQKTGFKPYILTDQLDALKYGIKDKTVNFFRKKFLQDKTYKRKLIDQQKKENLEKKLLQLPTDLDYILVIRPDYFDIPFIEKLKNKTKKLIAYQWDGFDKFPEIKKYINLFDTFFCFENEKDERLTHITNFYFDHLESVQNKVTRKKPLLYFVGLYWENREKKIDRFISEVSKMNVKLSINIQYWNKKERKNPLINYISQRISFSENLQNVIDADILLDFVDPLHNGLSIRFFEALYYKKKIITDNSEVKNYDFYHPNNIFVLVNENFDGIKKFIELPYHEISEQIVEKYSFSSWIKKITAN